MNIENSKNNAADEEINSSSNKSFKIWRTLVNARGIKKNKLAIVSGEKIIVEIIKDKKEIIQNVILPPNEKSSGFENVPLLSELNEDPEIKFIKLKNELFRDIDILGTGFPLLIVDIPDYETYDKTSFNESVLPVVPFQDPVNVGAVVRTAAAFGIRKIMLLKEAAIPYHPKSIRASAAQVFNMDFFEGLSITDLDNLGIPLVTLSGGGKNIGDLEFPEKYALLAGIEGPGIPDNLRSDFTVSIEIQPYVESLNAAISVSIALYEWRKQNPI